MSMNDINYKNQRSQNAQPSPQVAISGAWGFVPNKHLRETPGRYLPQITRTCTSLHCLPTCNILQSMNGIYDFDC